MKEEMEELAWAAMDEIVEMVLSWLPLTDVASAALVCRQWRRLVRHSALLRRLWRNTPCLLCYDNAASHHNKNYCHIMDPLSAKWLQFHLPTPSPQITFGGGGLVYRCSDGDAQVKYLTTKTAPAPAEWKELNGMWWWNTASPLVCYAPSMHSVLVLAKTTLLLPSSSSPALAANVVDLDSGTWYMCDLAPRRLQVWASDVLSCAVHESSATVYIVGARSGYMCGFHLRRRRWGTVYNLNSTCFGDDDPGIRDLNRAARVSVAGEFGDGVVVAAVAAPAEATITLWSVAVTEEGGSNFHVRQIGRMPEAMLLELLQTENEEQEFDVLGTLVFRGTANILYVCNAATGACCYAEIGGGGAAAAEVGKRKESSVKWVPLSPAPARRRRFEGASASASASASSLLQFGCWPVTVDHTWF